MDSHVFHKTKDDKQKMTNSNKFMWCFHKQNYYKK